MLRCVPVPCGPVAWIAPVFGFTSRFGSPYTWIGSTMRGTPNDGPVAVAACVGAVRAAPAASASGRSKAVRRMRVTPVRAGAPNARRPRWCTTAARPDTRWCLSGPPPWVARRRVEGVSESLFDALEADAAARVAPLAVRMRPQTLDDVVGQQHLLGPGAPLRRLVEGDAPLSVILWGPPGTGKTTLAMTIARSTQRRFRELSAVTAGVKDVRQVVEDAKRALGESGTQTVLFVDEVHRFSKTQQDALLPSVENRWVTLVAATTENPFFSVISPLLSRSPAAHAAAAHRRRHPHRRPPGPEHSTCTWRSTTTPSTSWSASREATRARPSPRWRPLPTGTG